MPIFKLFQCPYKTHRYDVCDSPPNFVINVMENRTNYYSMTAQGPHIRPGDYIEITQPDQWVTYQVDTIEYYSVPSDMWIAVLHRLSNALF